LKQSESTIEKSAVGSVSNASIVTHKRFSIFQTWEIVLVGSTRNRCIN
jgi:hypothetical protein